MTERDSKGKFLPGNPGRQPGACNKAKKDLQMLVRLLIEKNFAQIKRDMKSLKPRDRCRLFVDLLQFVLPKIRSTDLTLNYNSLSDEQLDYIIDSLLSKALSDEKQNDQT